MLNLMIICTGTLKERYLKDAVAEYIKRLHGRCNLEITELTEARLPENPSAALIDAALQKEAAAILRRVKNGSRIVALCIEGELFSSEQLAGYIADATSSGCSSFAFVIGSSYGLHESIKSKASLQLSMSRMTFPHQLARVLLCEQLYRAININDGGKYHK